MMPAASAGQAASQILPSSSRRRANPRCWRGGSAVFVCGPSGSRGTIWLKTATSDGVVHTGIPIALPQAIYSKIYLSMREQGAVRADISGELDFVDDPISRVFDTYERVPRVYVRVTNLRLCEPTPPRSLSASVAVSFVSEYQGPPRVYATYVTFEPNNLASFDDAVGWMKRSMSKGNMPARLSPTLIKREPSFRRRGWRCLRSWTAKFRVACYVKQ